MHYLFGLLCICTLAWVSLPGCGDSAAVCATMECPCTEQGILAAIAAGGGPYTFDCDRPTTVVTMTGIVIDNDVILDGEGNLTVAGDALSRLTVFSVPEGVNAELRRLTVTQGEDVGVENEGRLTIQDCIIWRNRSEAFYSDDSGGGVFNAGEMTLINSTVSENYAGHGRGGGIRNAGAVTLVNSTVSDNGADGGTGADCMAVGFSTEGR